MILSGAFYFDMNSVAPDTKRAAANRLSAVGVQYLDVAIMAPVHSARLFIPLLVSGTEAAVGVGIFRDFGFTNIRAVGDEVGRASSIKMIRSVMIKGIEALSAEMIIGASKALVEDEVLASPADGWDRKAAYNLERMARQGKRRVAEMEDVAKISESHGINPIVTRSTIIRQREMAVLL